MENPKRCVKEQKVDPLDEPRSNGFQEEKMKKAKVMIVWKKLQTITDDWKQTVATREGREHVTAKLYRVSFHELDADDFDRGITLLLWAPRYADRKTDFFGCFGSLLLEKNCDVQEIKKIDGEDIAVPIIKLKFWNIPIQIAFAIANTEVVYDKITPWNSKFHNSMDKKTYASTYGITKITLILQSVPDDKKFRKILKRIENWALNKGIFSKPMELLNTCNLAIMTAVICKDHPDLSDERLLLKFFEVYSKDWGKKPITLHVSSKDSSDGQGQMKSISPISLENLTRDVRGMSQKWIKFHLKAAWHYLKKNPGDCDKIFEEFNFLGSFKYFLRVDIFSKHWSNKEGELNSWIGWIERQLPNLPLEFDAAAPEIKALLGGCLNFYPITRDYNCNHKDYKFNKAFFFGIKTKIPWSKVLKSDICNELISNFSSKVNQNSDKTSSVKAQLILASELPDCVSKEKSSINRSPLATKPLKAKLVKQDEKPETKYTKSKAEEPKISGQEPSKRVKTADSTIPASIRALQGHDELIASSTLIDKSETSNTSLALDCQLNDSLTTDHTNEVTQQTILEYKIKKRMPKV